MMIPNNASKVNAHYFVTYVW